MASTLASAAQAAHSIATSILGRPQIQPGATIPVSADLKENEPEELIQLDLSGKNIIVGVTGAFTGTCTAQVPGYIKAYDEFRARGINNIYVVSVNDTFVMKAWKQKLAPEGTGVHFIADDKGAFTGSLGLLLDTSHRFGGLRSRRYVIVADNGKASSVAVEEVNGRLTVTAAEEVLARL